MTAVRAALRALDRHFFAPERLSDLALVRIVCVGATLLFFFPSVHHNLYLAQADASLFKPIPALKVLLLPLGSYGTRPSAMLLHAVWVGSWVAGVAAFVGLYARPALLLFAAGNTLLAAHRYSYGEIHHPDALLIITLWLLAVSPSAEVLSLDALIERMRCAVRCRRFTPRPLTPPESPYARWPLRTVQWLLVLAYFSAALAKLADGGFGWLNGYTLAYYFAEDGLRWGSPLGLSLARHPGLAALLSIGAVIFELTFALAIFVRWLAPVYLACGIAMHGVIYAVQRAPFFQYYFVYLAFIESLRLTLGRWLPSSAPAPQVDATVIYDGRSAGQIRALTILDSLDRGHRLGYVDAAAEPGRAAKLAPGSGAVASPAIRVVTPEGRVHSGFSATGALARTLGQLPRRLVQTSPSPTWNR